MINSKDAEMYGNPRKDAPDNDPTPIPGVSSDSSMYPRTWAKFRRRVPGETGFYEKALKVFDRLRGKIFPSDLEKKLDD